MFTLNYPHDFYDTNSISEDSHDLLHIFSVGFQHNEFWDAYAKRPEGRKDWQIIYLHNGYGYFQFENTVEKIGPDSLIIFKPMEPQQYIYYKEEAPFSFYTHFSGSIVQALLEKFNLIPNSFHNVFVMDDTEYEEIKNSFIQLKTVFDSNLGKNHFCWSEFLSLLNTLSTSIVDKNRHESNYSAHKKRIRTVIEDINVNYHIDRTLNDYAKMACMSPSYFSHIFKQTIGVSPIEYRKKIRIEQAQTLLTSTNKSIKDISEYIGYQEPSLFIKRFKSLVGVTPHQYRYSPPKKEIQHQ